MRALGVIPARGGSKGLPGKNPMKLGGKTLIQWAIEGARAAKSITEIIVTSDDPAICAEADKFCKWVLRRRPELATDECGMVPVLQDAVHAKAVTECGEYRYDLVVCLQPTSPFRTGEDIDNTVRMIHDGVDSAFTVTEAAYHPLKMLRCSLPTGGLVDFLDDSYARMDTRRQQSTWMQPSGAVYVTRRDVLMQGAIIGLEHRAWVVPWERSININTSWDLRIAEMVFEATRPR